MLFSCMNGSLRPLILIVLLLAGFATWRILTTEPAGKSVVDDASATDNGDDTTDYYYDDTASDDMATWQFPGVLPAEQIENKQVRIATNKGEIVVELYSDTAPMAVSNFVYLAQNGYYNGVIFHRVIEGFMIQGGDPLGQGFGGPGYKFPDELNDDRTYSRGTLAMANAGPNTNGSQFFIMHKDYPLPHDYTIFGKVISGLEVVDAIATAATDGRDRPLEEIVMESVTVEDKE